MANAACDLEPVFGRNAAEHAASQVSIPYKLERQLTCALAALPRRESRAFDLDGLLIGLAAQQVITSMAQGDTTPVLATIQFDVFATRPATERFFAVCAKIDSRVTARLVLLLSSLPNGLPRSRLQEAVNRLRPFCRGVGYQVEELAALAQVDLSNSYNPIVVLPAAECNVSAPRDLGRYSARCKAREPRFLFAGLRSRRDAATLRSLGADMLSMKRDEA